MIFKPTGFRELTAKLDFGIRNSDEMTLILITSDGEATYRRDSAGKDDLVRRFKPDSDLLLLAWTGNWHTDIFLLTEKDLDEQYCVKVGGKVE